MYRTNKWKLLDVDQLVMKPIQLTHGVKMSALSGISTLKKVTINYNDLIHWVVRHLRFAETWRRYKSLTSSRLQVYKLSLSCLRPPLKQFALTMVSAPSNCKNHTSTFAETVSSFRFRTRPQLWKKLDSMWWALMPGVYCNGLTKCSSIVTSRLDKMFYIIRHQPFYRT